MSKRRLTNRELNKQLNDMQNIDKLLNKSKKQYKNNNIQKSNKPSNSQKSKGDNSKQITLTSHCLLRAKERFKMDEPSAIGYFRSKLSTAKKIGLVISEDGSPCILYANGRVGMYVSLDHTEMKTVIKHESVTYEPIKSKVAELHAKEFRKIARKETTYKRRLENSILEVNLEIANLELRKHRTRSISVKNACEARIAALRLHIKEKEDEIEEIIATRRQIARSMVSVV
ncbi:hypothetical protein [Cytobacillus praedii]|uniref:Uncharacterized protein n=1 Tax=Cytobacillus praedii TaxID=1742358 RepID=A0A4R1AS26_9BACI|nr:hypothetical protein [Cytobacillus praedii]TCJ00011.1 hypothetical protein E0Y62_26980 [Cytobacillus praedii]